MSSYGLAIDGEQVPPRGMVGVMELSAGIRVRSAVCDTEVVVVKASGKQVELSCGGVPVLPHGTVRSGSPPSSGLDGGTLLGKRYVHESSGLEVLCTHGGAGTLSVGIEPLVVQQPKPLPSSD